MTQGCIRKLPLLVYSLVVWVQVFRSLQLSTGALDAIQSSLGNEGDDTRSREYHTTRIVTSSAAPLDHHPRDRPVPIPGPHPFQGAWDGNRSIVHDPYALRNRKRNPNERSSHSGEDLECDIPSGEGPEGDLGYQLFQNRLQISQQQGQATTSRSTNNQRILCAMYTYEGHANQTLAVADTWGSRCDGFVAASTITDLDLAKIHLSHLGAPGKYSSIWQKVRSLLVYIYQNFFIEDNSEFDFVFLSGDDTYLIVENLRSWLFSEDVLNETKHHFDPFYGGMYTRPIWRRDFPSDFVYHGGGSGYTLNRAALKLFVEQGLNQSECNPDLVKSEEDLFMGQCMRHLKVSPILAVKNRAFLQYPTDPKGVMDLSTLDKRVRQFWIGQLQWFGINHNISVKSGLEAVSEFSISFHGINTPSYMRRIDAILYGSLKRECERVVVSQGDSQVGNESGIDLVG